MPPKKRGRPAGVSSAAQQRPAKRVRVGETSIIGTQNSNEVTESGHSRRSSAAEPSSKTTRAKAPNKTSGSTSKTSTAGKATLQSRGKGASKLVGKSRALVMTNAEAEATETPKRKPGRPKSVKATAAAAVEEKAVTTPKKPVGRPRGTPKKSGGRPKKTVKDQKSAKAPAGTRKGVEAMFNREDNEDEEEEEVDIPLNGISNNVDQEEETEDTESGQQYWLMKAEPESRMEKGVDVKFSIDDLQAKGGAEAWDGVRNHGARNNMRAMRVGDHAFFYHSNTKAPGIVGIMEIVGEHTIDGTAFDPKHPYYDPKSSRENPKWDVVYVRFVRKFPEVIQLSDLRSFAKIGGALQNMQLLKQTRLSVSAVKPKEWEFILSLAGEETVKEEDNDEVEQAEDTPAKSGKKIVSGTKDGKGLKVGNLVDDEAQEGDHEEGDDEDEKFDGEAEAEADVDKEGDFEGANGDDN